MIPRLLQPPERSFFLFGPRGTGKSSWIKAALPDAVVLDLLESDLYLELLAAPSRLERFIPTSGHKGWVVIDEVQKVPALLDEVHRLIERRKSLRFALTGSSARKLRRGGVNLLAGRAVLRAMHGLTSQEIGKDDDIERALVTGRLPAAHTASDLGDAKDYLASYVRAYLHEEVQAEGLTRNLAAFSRFLVAASFSQGSPLNVSAVARECAVERKVVEDYFGILDDLMLGVRLPVFTKRAQRQVVAHPKFYFFDAGVFRALRPRGPLDDSDAIAGPALETLVLQELRALNDYLGLGYDLAYWRTVDKREVDFVLHGEHGLHAIEVKATTRLRGEDFAGLRAFMADYPIAKACLVYGGRRTEDHDGIEVVPVQRFLAGLAERLGSAQ